MGTVLGIRSSSTMSQQSADRQVVEGNNKFTTELYKVLSKKSGNVFFSPISVHAVLSMAFQGAQGTTAKRFGAALKVPDAKAAAEGYNAIMSRLNSVEKVTLLMANKIFLMEGAQLLEDFKNAVTKNFLSEVQLLNFAQNASAAKTINDWVEDKTHEKIKDLIQKDDLNEFTRLVLVNAIYFKGNWKHQFDPAATKIEPFYLNDVETVNVHMMHIKETFGYKEDTNLDAQILEMPYVNENLSMIIILPRQRSGIVKLEKKLATTNLTEITQGMWNTEVNVALPRFKIEQTIDLKDSLTKLGLGEIFDESKANFRGMIPLNPLENLYVSKVIQKAFIEVNEEGAEAAAATGMIIRATSWTPPTIVIANHPFVFLLKSKEILFVGKITYPSSSE